MQFAIAEKYNGFLYRCIVTDASGNSVTSTGAKVTVATGLAITGQPSDVTGAIGEMAVFTVTATGTGLSYRWQVSKNNGGSWTDLSSGISGYHSATMQFAIAEKYNGFLYRCIVTDASGNSVTSNAAKVSVK